MKYEWIPLYGINYNIGIDGISFIFIFLVNFSFFLSALLNFNKNNKGPLTNKSSFSLLLILQSMLLAFYMSLDLFQMFTFFFIMIIPVFFLLLMNREDENSRTDVIRFTTLSLLSSLLFLLVILGLYFANGATRGSFDLLKLYEVGPWIKNIEIFHNYFDLNNILFFLMLLAISIRMFLVPFHKELHTIFNSKYISNSNSELLILSLFPATGIYLILKILIPLFSESMVKNSIHCTEYASFGILYASIGMLVDRRTKKYNNEEKEEKISYYNYLFLTSTLFLSITTLEHRAISFGLVLLSFISIFTFFLKFKLPINTLIPSLIIINIILGMFERAKFYSLIILFLFFISICIIFNYSYKKFFDLKYNKEIKKYHIFEKLFLFITIISLLVVCVYPTPVNDIFRKPLKQLEVFLDNY
ncbi:MAG: hypothetical protein HQK51_02945 [Oligoflexia bacterium]|nr:hypothetical protein [Oligoflexia bacterium]